MGNYEKNYEIKKGDIVTIKSQGLTVTGEVDYVDFWEESGWDITVISGKGSVHSWKQQYDKGEILKVIKLAEVIKLLDEADKDLKALKFKLEEDYPYENEELFFEGYEILTDILEAVVKLEALQLEKTEVGIVYNIKYPALGEVLTEINTLPDVQDIKEYTDELLGNMVKVTEKLHTISEMVLSSDKSEYLGK